MRSPRMSRMRRLVTSSWTASVEPNRSDKSPPASASCSMLSNTINIRAAASRSRSAPPRSCRAHRRRATSQQWAARELAHEAKPARRTRFRPGTAPPPPRPPPTPAATRPSPRSDDRHHPHIRLREQIQHPCDVAVPADEPRHRSRQWGSRHRSRRPRRRLRRSLEALGQ